MCFETCGSFGTHSSLGPHGIFVLSVIWLFFCPERDLQLTAKLLRIRNPPLHFCSELLWRNLAQETTWPVKESKKAINWCVFSLSMSMSLSWVWVPYSHKDVRCWVLDHEKLLHPCSTGALQSPRPSYECFIQSQISPWTTTKKPSCIWTGQKVKDLGSAYGIASCQGPFGFSFGLKQSPLSMTVQTVQQLISAQPRIIWLFSDNRTDASAKTCMMPLALLLQPLSALKGLCVRA